MLPPARLVIFDPPLIRVVFTADGDESPGRYGVVLAEIPNGKGAVGPAQVGPAQVGPAQVGPAQVGLAQVGPAQVGPAQVGPAQVGPAQVGPAQVGPAQVGLAQVGPAQVGPAQVGLAQVGPAQVGPAQVGLAQVGPAQVGPAQVASLGPMLPPAPMLCSNTDAASASNTSHGAVRLILILRPGCVASTVTSGGCPATSPMRSSAAPRSARSLR
jgi:hypothetical protein